MLIFIICLVVYWWSRPWYSIMTNVALLILLSRPFRRTSFNQSSLGDAIWTYFIFVMIWILKTVRARDDSNLTCFSNLNWYHSVRVHMLLWENSRVCTFFSSNSIRIINSSSEMIDKFPWHYSFSRNCNLRIFVLPSLYSDQNLKSIFKTKIWSILKLQFDFSKIVILILSFWFPNLAKTWIWPILKRTVYIKITVLNLDFCVT